MVKYRCQACLWFDREHSSLRELPTNLGYCRKHKPVVYQLPKDIHYYGGWPLVDILDLCGEWRKDEAA